LVLFWFASFRQFLGVFFFFVQQSLRVLQALFHTQEREFQRRSRQPHSYAQTTTATSAPQHDFTNHHNNHTNSSVAEFTSAPPPLVSTPTETGNAGWVFVDDGEALDESISDQHWPTLDGSASASASGSSRNPWQSYARPPSSVLSEIVRQNIPPVNPLWAQPSPRLAAPPPPQATDFEVKVLQPLPKDEIKQDRLRMLADAFGVDPESRWSFQTKSRIACSLWNQATRFVADLTRAFRSTIVYILFCLFFFSSEFSSSLTENLLGCIQSLLRHWKKW
jgi:hypothetical protein